MTKRTRRTFTASQKADIVRRYLVDKVPISDLCDELDLQPTQIYQWQKQLFEGAAAVFEKSPRKGAGHDRQAREIQRLEAKLQLKNEVVAELLQEHVQLKKALGEP